MRVRAIKGAKLYQILFYGVILSVAAIGALAFWGVREIRTDAAVVAVENSARGLSGAVTVLLNAVRNSNEEIGEGVLSSLEPDNLRSQFKGIIDNHPMLAALVLSNEKGLLHMMTRRKEGIAEVVPKRDGKEGVAWTLFKEDGGQANDYAGWPLHLSEVDATLVNEMEHLNPGEINWRSSKPFHHTGATWITASSLASTEDGQPVMLSFVFPVDALLSQLSGAERGGAERIFLYWNDGHALPVAGLNTGVDESARSGAAFKAENIQDPVIREAVTLLSTNASHTPFAYNAEGEVWWAYALPLTVFGDTLSLGVAVPRRNIVSTLTSDSFLQSFSAVLILLAAGVLLVLHRNRARIEAMGRRRDMPEHGGDILSLINEGESGQLEFKQTLRFNLKSGKNGKEIEHACLKTVAAYLNTEGGTLLVGVSDEGEIAGFEEDKFNTADHALLHFNNLVNQHLGAEHTRFIEAAVIDTGGVPVLCIHCSQSPVPVILKDGKSEEFYVRSGPASRQLSLTQFYEWLKEH